MSDSAGCTIVTIGLPNPNQRSIAKTLGFLHPHICTHFALGVPSRFSHQAVVIGNRAIFAADRILAKHNRKVLRLCLEEDDQELTGQSATVRLGPE
jgi:hypothetical protein